MDDFASRAAIRMADTAGQMVLVTTVRLGKTWVRELAMLRMVARQMPVHDPPLSEAIAYGYYVSGADTESEFIGQVVREGITHEPVPDGPLPEGWERRRVLD